MRKIFIFIVLFLTTMTLMARENPFEAINGTEMTGKAIYKKDTRENFTNAKVKLPSSARILKKVELSFQNIDGSIETKSVKIDKKIDWHDELVLKKVNEIDENMALPLEMAQKVEPKKKTEINFKDALLLSIEGKNLFIKTDDVKIRDFMVTNPNKIVIDLKKELSFYTKVYKLKTKFFKVITIGKHAGYYRVAVELDGKYLYDIQKAEDGYLISLR